MSAACAAERSVIAGAAAGMLAAPGSSPVAIAEAVKAPHAPQSPATPLAQQSLDCDGAESRNAKGTAVVGAGIAMPDISPSIASDCAAQRDSAPCPATGQCTAAT